MKSRKLQPQHHGWIETILDKEHVDFLWQSIEKGGKDVKHELAGNISKSFQLKDDEDDTFFNSVLFPHVEMYRGMNNNGIELLSFPVNADLEIYLKDFWVNYQYKHEFNPPHNHSGVYSFVIWMKIPTHWRDQIELPFLEGIKEGDRKVSNFEFEYIDMMGHIRHYDYRLEPSMEGHMLFFPSKLMHSVYPFYNCDDARISISGNLWLREVK